MFNPNVSHVTSQYTNGAEILWHFRGGGVNTVIQSTFHFAILWYSHERKRSRMKCSKNSDWQLQTWPIYIKHMDLIRELQRSSGLCSDICKHLHLHNRIRMLQYDRIGGYTVYKYPICFYIYLTRYSRGGGGGMGYTVSIIIYIIAWLK